MAKLNYEKLHPIHDPPEGYKEWKVKVKGENWASIQIWNLFFVLIPTFSFFLS